MLYRTIFVCAVVLVIIKHVEMDPVEINFHIKLEQNNLTCGDHRPQVKIPNYTVLEGDNMILKIHYASIINYLNCVSKNNKDKEVFVKNVESGYRNVTTVLVKNEMSDIWNCTMLSHKDNSYIHPVVNFKNNCYAAVYCIMQVQVRQKNPPQTILVNNMVLEPVLPDLSKNYVHFTAVYEYENGDFVNVTCIPANTDSNNPSIKMEYDYADKLSDKFKSMNLSSKMGVGFRAKLHSVHHNTRMLCTLIDPTDRTETKVTVTFVMRTFDNIIKMRINGMIMRPKKTGNEKNKYEIKYKYIGNAAINVSCENELTDGGDKHILYWLPVKGASASPLPGSDSYFIQPSNNKELECEAFYSNDSSAEKKSIKFTEDKHLLDTCSLHMDLSPKGIMELYETDGLRVIYYEFENNEELTLKCHSYCKKVVHHLLFHNHSDHTANPSITTKLHPTLQKYDSEVCYLIDTDLNKTLREIRVIFEKKYTPTSVPTVAPTLSSVPTPYIHKDSESMGDGVDDGDPVMRVILPVVCGVAFIVIICIATVIIKLRKRNHSQRGPYDRNYENLQNKSQASIPPYPPQWESNYAVPVDQRNDNATYSVPYRPEGDMYSTPIPKSQRNKKNCNTDPTYAIIDVKHTKGQRNSFKDLDDPNYSEVVVNKKEECYAQVVPKSQRNRMRENDATYANVTNEQPCVNIGNNPEPTYCEPNVGSGQRNQYANINNAYYANSPNQEYVEPTYCEANVRK